ncbi:MAG TPA: substrate-binding domain-containing protein [Syntrophorhabdales bacterium]|nr:substrate-binding domain-containing protein [Syntrophorhabdales bacterium]
MKKLSMALAIGVLGLSMAGACFGGATDMNINIYGASAQVDFWSALAPTYLNAGAGANCTGAPAASCVSFTPSDGTPAGVYYHGAKYTVCEATGPCTVGGVAAGDTFRIRVGAYDSDDGIMGVLGQANPGAVDVMNCPTTGTVNGHGLNYRTLMNTLAGGAAPSNLDCFPVTLGAADVSGSTIVQSSEGQLKGPNGPGSVTHGLSLALGGAAGPAILRDLGDFVANPPTVKTCGAGSVGLTDNHPFIVPFCFFANKDAKAVGDGLLAANLTNVTKAMAQQIFTGIATDWHQYFPGGVNPIAAGAAITGCMRVAGSGTQGAFQSVVIDANKIGPNLPTLDSSILSNNLWFNNSSTDMLNCIDGTPGAIGFVDCDKALGAHTYPVGGLTYNGVTGNAANIKNGLYEFFTLEHIFEPSGGYAGNLGAAVSNLLTWSKTNLPASKAGTWTLSNGMTFSKPTDWVTPPAVGAYDAGTCYE